MAKKLAKEAAPTGLLRAREAAEFLGIKRETLYAYVARGLLPSVGGARALGRLYAREDLERLRARHDARAGHTAVAAAAMQWGEPVLDTAITGIDDRGPRYRGQLATRLVEERVSFERVAELLWTGTLPEQEPVWRSFPTQKRRAAPTPAQALLRYLVARSARAPLRGPLTDERELVRARILLPALATQWGTGAVVAQGTIVERVAASLGIAATKPHLHLLEAALVLLADHELNASAFATRVAASAGAELYACLCAGVATASGPKHAAAAARAEALLALASNEQRAVNLVRERVQRGEALEGFHHPLYPKGDPRATALLSLVEAYAPKAKALRQAQVLSAVVKAHTGLLPTVDLGLAVVSRALQAPPDSATFLFMLGRTAGWIAQVLEQRAQPTLLRPRARYVGA